MTDVHAVLSAGGIAALEEAPDTDLPHDTVDARTYQHPALGDRPVVRLGAATLAPGQRVEMDFLGFEAPAVREGIGVQRRQALGFPGWPLVHDPKRAKLALEVVKDLKKALRRARSKPGHANDDIEAIGKKLERSVPHFLPSYYEEAGRGFIEGGNLTYASRAFNKAREAERAHALPVDEGQRRDAFLEFALAGALTSKALEQYAQDLSKALDAEAAYAHFKDLCVRRTLGGMPPWAGMAKVLRRLCKAAERDADAEEREILTQLLESPAAGRAPWAFWKSYTKSLVALCDAAPTTRTALLDLFPSVELTQWLPLLESCGALEGLRDESAPQPSGGLARWFTRAVEHNSSGWREDDLPPAVFELLRAAAPRLVKAEQEVVLERGRWRPEMDLDLLELALSLGVPVKAPGEDTAVNLKEWSAGEGEHRLLDPVHVAGDARFAKLITDALDGTLGDPDFDRAAHGKKGLTAAKRAWLDQYIEQLDTGAMGDAERALTKLEKCAKPSLFAEFPEAHEALRQRDLSKPLAETLRGGLIDEFGWPALEKLLEDLEGAERPGLAGSFPYLIVHNATRAVVLGPEGVVLEHDLRLPKKTEVKDLRYADGQLLVGYDKNWDLHAYWSGAPTKKKKLDGWAFGASVSGFGTHLEDGSVTEGGKAFRPGDEGLPDRQPFVHDGTTFWRLEWRGDDEAWVEFDPKTGKTGRKSLPSFFEEIADPDYEHWPRACTLMPLPATCADSPLGSKGGLTGLRTRRAKSDGTFELQTLTGERHRMTPTHGRHIPQALVRFPGHDRARVLRYDDGDAELWSADDAQCLAALVVGDDGYAAGTPYVLPVEFWHMLQVRDAEGSARLRAVEPELAKQLLVQAAEEATAEGLDMNGATAKLAMSLLPEVRDERLLRGTVGAVIRAARQHVRLQRYIAQRDPKNAAAAAPEGPTDADLSAALDWFADGSEYEFETEHSGNALAQATTVSRFFEDGAAAEIPGSGVGWPLLIPRIGLVAYRAVCPGVDDKTRAALLDFLEAWRGLIFADRSRAFRVFSAEGKPEDLPFDFDIPTSSSEFTHVWGLGQIGDSRYLYGADLWEGAKEPVSFMFLEYAPDGEFRVPDKFKLESQSRLEPDVDGEWLAEFVSLARERGAPPYRPEGAELLAERTGIDPAEATLLWAGLPNVMTWEYEFLSKDLREALGLKVKAADAARDTLKEVAADKLARFVSAALPTPPSLLWDDPLGPDGPAANMAKAWNRSMGRRIPVPPALVADLQKAIQSCKAGPMLHAVLQPTKSPLTTKERKIKGREDWSDYGYAQSEQFDAAMLANAVRYVAYLNLYLPVGDPIRSALPEFVAAVHRRLDSKTLWLPFAETWSEKLKTQKTAIDLVNAKPRKQGESTSAEDGRLFVVYDEFTMQAAFRPNHLQALDQEGTLDKIVQLADGQAGDGLVACRMVRGPGLRALLDRIADTPLEDGQWEMNPLLSAPEAVDTVRQKWDLSEEAAVLYLMTLALPAPSKKQVQTVTGLTSAKVTKAGKELCKQELLLEAKRARAGRTTFLPGGWEALKAPHMPLETWKLPMYGVTRDKNGLHIPLDLIAPLAPVHGLFETALERVLKGDLPAYEETP